MKKLFTLLMTLVLVFSVSDIALADQAKMTVSGKESVKRGENIEYTVSLADCDKANTLGIEIEYDESVLTKVTNDCGWVNEGTLQDFDPVKNNGVWAVETAKSLNGDVFKLAFTVNGDAAIEKTQVKVTVIVKNDAQVVGTYTDTIMVQVVCDHVYGEWTNKDANNHSHVCKNCKTEAVEAHKWDAGKVTKEPTATATGTKVYTCSVCKATKEETVPATGTTPDDSNQGGTTTPGGTTKPDGSNQGGTTTPDGSGQDETVTPDGTEEGTEESTEDVSTNETEKEESTEDQTVDNPEEQPKDDSNGGSIVAVIVVIVLIAVLAVVFLKKKK